MVTWLRGGPKRHELDNRLALCQSYPDIEIVDRIKELSDGKRLKLSGEHVDTIVIHRVGLNLKTGKHLGTTALEVGRAFIDDPEVAKWTGGEQPYHFYIDPDGTISQALALVDTGRHSRAFNSRAIAIAVICDARVEPPTDEQFDAAVRLSTCVAYHMGIKAGRIRGHTELGARATSDPMKQCPGAKFNMKKLRGRVERDLYRYRAKALEQEGIRIW